MDSESDDDDKMPPLRDRHDILDSDIDTIMLHHRTTTSKSKQHDTATFSDEESDDDDVLNNNVSDAIKIKAMEKVSKILGKKKDELLHVTNPTSKFSWLF